MGIYLCKKYESFINKENINFNLENYIKNKGNEKNILKLTNQIINLLISKIELKITKLEFIFIDYQMNNYFDTIELFKKDYKITNNKLEINFNNLNKNYNEDCFITTELILKNKIERKKFLITIYYDKTNIYNVLINNKSNYNFNLEIIYYGKNKKEFSKNLINVNYKDDKNKKNSFNIDNYEEIDSYENFKKLNNIDDSFFKKIKIKGNKIKKTDFPIRRRFNIINITSQNFNEISKLKYNKNNNSTYNSYSLIKFIDINKRNKYIFKVEKNKTIIKLDYEIEEFLLKFFDIYNKFVYSKEDPIKFYNNCQIYKSNFEKNKDKLSEYFLFQKCKYTYYNEKPYLKNKSEEQKFEHKFISYSILLIIFFLKMWNLLIFF